MTKTKSMRTIIISLLMFAMIFCGFAGLGAIEASAEDVPEAVWGTSADDLGGEGREGTLAEAVAAANDNSDVKYIKMNRDVDITVDNYFDIRGGDFTLDMGGYTLSWGSIRFYIYGGKVVFKNGTFTSAANQAIWVDGDEGDTEITFESGTYNNPSGTFVYVEEAKQLTVKQDVTMRGAISIEIGSSCAAALIEGASLDGSDWDISCFNDNTVITAGIYYIDFYYCSLDLTQHPDPTGTTIIDFNSSFWGDPIYVEGIKLPDGYGLFDIFGVQHTERGSSSSYQGRLTVRKLHEHEWEYTASGTTITATCANTDGNCDKTDGCSVSIAIPDSVEYTGSAIEAKVTNTLPTDVTVTVVYTGENLVDDKPVRNGTYTAKITLGEQEISVEYTIIHSEHDCVYSESTDTEHKESCECGYEATVPHAFDEDTGICSCGGMLVNYLDVVIQKIASDLEKAERDLADAIAWGDAELDGKITNLNAALESAKAALEATDAANKEALEKELEKELEKAETALRNAINGVQSNLDNAKAELDKAIADGDTALDGKITALNEALATAKAALEAADTANKSEMTTKIDEADATLDAAIKAVQKNLNDLKAALEAKDNEYAKADAENKAALQAKDAELDAKDNELQTFIIIACVISGVAFCGCGALAVWIFIDKKKKI